MAANIRPIKNHLRFACGRASVSLCALVFALSLASWDMITGPQLKRPIEHALVDAPLSALAGVIHTTPNALVARLERHGVKADAGRSVRELATASGVGETGCSGSSSLIRPRRPPDRRGADLLRHSA